MFRQELALASPWINAAGTLGFAPPARWPLGEPPGAFVTNPISMAPRFPAAGRALLRYPGGFLLHTGHPNPGLSRAIRRYGERWAQSRLPVWVHLLASDPTETQAMVRRLEGVEGVMAVELGIPPLARAEESLALVQAAYGELPLIVHLPLTAAGEGWLEQLPELGVSAIALGAPRGTLISDTGKPVGGSLFGPALLPLLLSAVQTALVLGLQVIAGAGVYRLADAQALRDAGASAVMLDAVLWRGWVD